MRETDVTRQATVPDRGLVIQAVPLEKILSGRKTMELRAQHTRQLGPIALIRKASGRVYGVADVVESVGPMDYDAFVGRTEEHAVEPERSREVFDKGWVYGWRLANVRRLREPVPYDHRGMSQVKLETSVVEAIRRQLSQSDSQPPPRRATPSTPADFSNRFSAPGIAASALAVETTARFVTPRRSQGAAMKPTEIEAVLVSRGFVLEHGTKRKRAYRGPRGGLLYLNLATSSGESAVIVHPGLRPVCKLLESVPGLRSANDFYHSSNMRYFPTRRHGGEKPIPYGIAFSIASENALVRLLEEVECVPVARLS